MCTAVGFTNNPFLSGFLPRHLPVYTPASLTRRCRRLYSRPTSPQLSQVDFRTCKFLTGISFFFGDPSESYSCCFALLRTLHNRATLNTPHPLFGNRFARLPRSPSSELTAREGVPEAGCHLRGSQARARQEGCQGEKMSRNSPRFFFSAAET